MWNIKNKYNKTDRLTNIENTFLAPSGEKEGGRGKMRVRDYYLNNQ